MAIVIAISGLGIVLALAAVTTQLKRIADRLSEIGGIMEAEEIASHQKIWSHD